MMRLPSFTCRRLLLLALAPAVLAGALRWNSSAVLGQSLSVRERVVAERLQATMIRQVTLALVDKEMEGRGTGQPGGVKAARYIADQFARLGLKPLGDRGSYLQAVPFQTVRVHEASSLKIADEAIQEKTHYRYERPKYPPKETIEVQGDLVCVDRDAVLGKPGKSPEALNVKGKIAVLVEGSPGVFELARCGAAGILVAVDRPALPSHLGDGGPHNEVTLARPLPGMAASPMPVAYVARPVAERLFTRCPQSYAETLVKARAGKPFLHELGQKAALSLRLTIEPRAAYNVIGVLEGSDPRLKNEAVIYSAHYDAYGKDPSGLVRPGAADNALGVAKMLAIAEAMTRSPERPRRSVIFLSPTAEELGLLGARYWLEHPTWPLAKLAANLNFDGIDNETYGPLRAVVVEGLGHSNLDPIAGRVARDMNLLPVPDIELKERVFYRSDHYEFALRGVPAIYVLGLSMPEKPGGAKPGGLLGALAGARSTVEGLAEVEGRAREFLAKHYHQPSDVVRPEWNWEGVRTATVFYLVAGLRVANAEKMPEWLPTSEYNRPRGARHPDRQL